MADILNSNDYKRGFDDGKADAMAEKDKNYNRSGMSLKFAIHGSPAIDTYNKGYNAGYETAIKSKLTSEVSQTQPIRTEIINNSNNHKINSKMADSKEFQLELAEDLKSYLHGFQERLGIIADKYKNKYENLGNVMITEFHEEFSENYENTIKIISDLVEHINDNDIPHVEKYINWLEGGW